MPVTVGAAQEPVSGGDSICDVIEDVLLDAEDLVEEVSWGAANAQRDRMQRMASEHPRWASMASAIDMWADPTGNYQFGVRDEALQQQAFDAEYGTKDHPPVPLIRMGLRSAVVDMGWSMREAFERSGY